MNTPNTISGRKASGPTLAGIALSIVGIFLMIAAASYCNSLAAKVESFHFIATLLIWGITWLHINSIKNAEDESIAIAEAERARKLQGREKLFNSDEAQIGTAQTRLKEVEKYIAPIAGVIIILFQGIIGSLFLYSLINKADIPTIGMPIESEFSNAVFCAGASFILAFFSFILGKYTAGLAQIKNRHILRAGAGFTIGNALICFAMSLSSLLGYYGILWADAAIGWITASLMVIIAFEMLVNFLLDFYRPRVAGSLSHPVYESRITSLLAEPKGIFHTFAHTLDYQFGFKVSDTWFFQFLNKAIAPLILFQLATLYLLTCIVVVNPGEVAVIERWGRPRGIEKLPSAPSIDMTEQEKIALENEWDKLSSPLTPGIHIKYPWPIEITKKVMLEEVKEITIGAPQENIGKSEGVGVMKDVVSWDKVHTKDEFKYIMPLSSIEPKGTKNTIKSRQESMHNLDFMFISGVVSIHYTIGRYAEENIPGKIKPGDVYRYLYRYKDPLNLMITMAEQEVTRYWAGADFWDVLVKDRTRVENNLRDDIQKAADKSGIGVRVILVSLSNMHPPAGEIGKAYQEVVGAKEEREAKILEAKAKAAAVTASIEGQKAKILNDAKGYYNERTLVSKASSQRFKSQMKAYSAAPEVYIHREKMTAIEEGLSSSRKVLVAPPTVTTVIDDKQDFTAAGVGEALIREAANQ